MFTPDSRYAGASTYTVTLPSGATVSAVTLPLPRPAPPIGYHRRSGGDRLDLVATQYLNAPTGFWRLCDTNNAILAGSLGARALIGIPQGGR
jgi:hypothetical protein